MAIKASIFGNLDEWGLKRILHDSSASVVVFKLLSEIDECDATARNDTFVERGFSSGNGIIDAIFLFVDFSFSSTTDFNYGNAAFESGGAFVEFASFVIGSGSFGLSFDLCNASLNFGWFAGALNDGSFVFGSDNLMSRTKNFETGVLEAHAFIGGNNGSASQNSDVFHDFLAAITEGWSL